MSSRKRAREYEDFQIRVAEGEPVAAQGFVLRTLSSCARDLPADTAEWDVSGLLLDGKPFSRETVACWLQCGYSAIYAEDHQLEPDSITQITTASGLAQVLAFAHAVGSFKGLLKAACSRLQQLKFVVQLPEQVLELPLADYTLSFIRKQLVQFNPDKDVKIGTPLISVEQQHGVQQQVAQQLSALLQLAHMLCLRPLLSVLHQFILHNVWQKTPRLLSGVVGLIFTDEVVEAALSSSTLSKEAYISSVLSQPCSLTPGEIGHSSLLKPVGRRTYDTSTDKLVFDAQLLRDFAGARAGDTVNVTLDLFGTQFSMGRMEIRSTQESKFVVLPVQLLLGHTFSDAAALDQFLSLDAPV